MRDTITQERLKELLRYDAETGVFTFRIKRGNKRAGSVAGKLLQGYVRIKVDRIEYAAHRLVWLYVHGKWPIQEIDHINRIPHDNRFKNLREATSAQNKQNSSIRKSNTSGFVGVSWSKRDRRWRASIKVNYRHISLGGYSSVEEAAIARAEAEAKYHTFK